MTVLSQDAALAYASKPNIRYPGTQADADLAETAALVRWTDSDPTVTLDAGDLTITVDPNTDTPRTSIPHAGN